MHMHCTLVFAVGLGLNCYLAFSAWASQPLDIGSRLELFVDDYLVDRLTGVHQQVHQPKPQEVVLVTDQSWEGNTCAYYTIFQDGDLYRMFYRGSHADEKTQRAAHAEVTCYAESRDGVHWTRPALGLYAWEGSKQNNIILTELGTHCFVAFRDDNPACPPEARYKGISRGKRGSQSGLFVFQSADAIHWTLMSDSPVITQGAFDSQNLAFWDPHTRMYVDYHRAFSDGVRSIMTCTSTDYLQWTKPQLLRYANAPQQHLYTNAIRPYPRAPHLRIGFPTRFLPEDQQVEPIFMSSRDGLNFTRWDQAVIPRTAPEDRGGNRSNYMANGLVMLPGNDREYSVYATEAYYTGPDSRLRRFSYRVDGFVSIHSDTAGGELITKPLTFAGQQLVLNYETSPQGSVQVEIQDERGQPIPGFELSSCAKLQGDELAQAVTWQNAPPLNALAGKPVRIRLQMSEADLYSLQFKP